MELVMQSRNIDIDSGLKEYIHKKIGRLERFLPALTEAKVEVSYEETRAQNHRVVVQVTLNCNGTLLRGEKRASNVRAAVDAVAHLMDRRIADLKGRLYKSQMSRKAGRGASIRKAAAPTPEEVAEEGLLSKVSRVKRFPIKPISVEEAISQMELLGHVFFLFLNEATGEFNVVYRRREGDYGIIEAEPA